MDVLGTLKNQHQQKTEAIKEAAAADTAKASEYAALSKRIDGLESTINDLQIAINRLNHSLQGLTPAKIDEVQKAGVKIFAPLKNTAAEINDEIKTAGKEAVKRIKQAGEKDWKEYLFQGFVTATIYCFLTSAVMWWGMGIKNINETVEIINERVELIVKSCAAIHYNQTTGKYETYDPWHLKEFMDKYRELDKQFKQNQLKSTQKNQN